MATLIKNSTFAIAETLNKMQTTMQQAAASATPEEYQAEYDNLASSLEAVITNTQYNGISLLDGTQWGTDERLARDGNTATLGIHMGGGVSSFSLRDLSTLGAYNGLDLQDHTALTDKLAQVSKDLGTVSTMSTGYEAIAGSYLGEAKRLDSQAEILAQTAQRAQYGASSIEGSSNSEGAIQNILLDFILRDQGKLVDKSS